jgi:ribosomal protein S12 methylthiotransferase accessory factor
MQMLDLGGTYRAVSPEETLAKIEPMMWQAFGISRVANVTGLDNVEIPTYVAVRPRSKLLTTAQGKGINHPLAKTSALMESIEGWHSENMREPDLFGSYKSLHKKYPLIPLEPHLNGGPLHWHDIESLAIPWAKGRELNTGRDVYFPYTLINVDTSRYLPGYRYFPPSTNGLASGNTYLEALCHALFEVIERECEASNENFLNEPKVDLNNLSAPHLLELKAHLSERNLSLDVWDLTNELKVPTFYAHLNDANDLRSVGTQCGSGSHFSSVVALSRAITEAIQARATVISGARDDIYPSMYKNHVKYGLVEEFQQEGKAHRPFVETKTPETFEETLASLLQNLNDNGLKEAIVYDHTREEFGIPVVHAIVPGLNFDMLRHTNDG